MFHAPKGLKLNDYGNLRDRLRADTRAAHDRVDAAYIAHDIAVPDGLALFLTDHLRAFRALGLADGPAAALREEYCAALEADLAKLGVPAPRLSGPTLRVLSEAAMYIFLGSRRGAQMMRRHWAANARGAARDAGAFLSLDPRNEDWRRLCTDLAARSPDGAHADRVVADTVAIFDLFDPQPAGLPERRHA